MIEQSLWWYRNDLFCYVIQLWIKPKNLCLETGCKPVLLFHFLQEEEEEDKEEAKPQKKVEDIMEDVGDADLLICDNLVLFSVACYENIHKWRHTTR